jgi:hypothetical protein
MRVGGPFKPSDFGLPDHYDVSMITAHPTGPHKMGPSVQACQDKANESRTRCVKNVLGANGPFTCQSLYEQAMMACVTDKMKADNVAAGRPATLPTGPQPISVCEFGCQANWKSCANQKCGISIRPGCADACDADRVRCRNNCKWEKKPLMMPKDVQADAEQRRLRAIFPNGQAFCPVSLMEVSVASDQLTPEQKKFCEEMRRKALAKRAIKKAAGKGNGKGKGKAAATPFGGTKKGARANRKISRKLEVMRN